MTRRGLPEDDVRGLLDRHTQPLAFAMMARPRGGEWLEDEIAGLKRLGVDLVVSLLHPYEPQSWKYPKKNIFAILSRVRGIAVPDTEAQVAWFHSVAVRLCGFEIG